MTHMDCTDAVISARPVRRSVLTRLLSAHALWQQRRHLATLDDAALRDMGLTHADIRAEIARPIWNAPDQWLR
jgi:uncharacterized protein YjiS (DUF1127 family)